MKPTGLRILAALAALTLVAPLPAAAQGAVQMWLTTGDRAHLLERQPAAATQADIGRPDAEISVDPQTRYQAMIGFGAAITDASAQVIRHDLSPARSRALMRELFSPDQLDLSFVRLTIGASDFSTRAYSYDDMPPGQRDPQLQHFSIAPARADVLPLVRQARRLNPQLTLMASPWSPPGWMKTSDSLIGGTLAPDAYQPFADYLVRYLQAMKAAGAPIWAITVQNEPGFEPGDYPGMRLPPASRARFDADFLGPDLVAHGLKTKIFDYDHNWDQPDSPRAVLSDPRASRYIAGVAWHCYNGDVSAQTPVHDAFPDKQVIFSECSGGEWASDFASTFDWMMQNLMIGSTRGYARGVILWNLALDENHGPHHGGCTNCRGVVTINSRTGEVTRNLEYYVLGHVSRFVRPGARRIRADSSDGDVHTVGFRNPDGSVAVVVLNSGKSARSVRLTGPGRIAQIRLPQESAATLVWPAAARR